MRFSLSLTRLYLRREQVAAESTGYLLGDFLGATADEFLELLDVELSRLALD